MTLKNEDGLTNLARMLEHVGEPTDDVAPSFPVACAQHTIDVIARELPATLPREYPEATPEVEAVAGKDLSLVWFEGDAVVGYSAWITQPKGASGDFA